MSGILLAPAGCAGTTAGAGVRSSTPTTELTELRRQNAAQRTRIEELETRQAMLLAELRRLRRAPAAGGDEGGTTDAEASAEPPVPLRAGREAPPAPRRESGRRRRGVAEDAPRGAEPPPPVATGEAEEPSDGDAEGDEGGSRPLLRIYGGSDPGASSGGMTNPAPAPPPVAPPAFVPPPLVPPGLPAALPMAPVPDLPASALQAPAAPQGPSPDALAVPEYQAALRHVRERHYPEALAALSAFLDRHPHHPYADNALYWRGEVHYARRAYRDAIRDFSAVVQRYPDGNKVADALLKLGLSYVRLGDPARARTYLGRVAREFPGTPAAEAAQREIPR